MSSRRKVPDLGPVVLWDGRVDLHADWVAGLPQWRWRCGPSGLATIRQLADVRLRPGGQEPYGRIVCRRGRRWAWLYRVDLAQPKRTPSAAVLAALDKAMAARRWCSVGRHDAGYCIPWAALGMCVECWEHRQTPTTNQGTALVPAQRSAHLPVEAGCAS